MGARDSDRDSRSRKAGRDRARHARAGGDRGLTLRVRSRPNPESRPPVPESRPSPCASSPSTPTASAPPRARVSSTGSRSRTPTSSACRKPSRRRISSPIRCSARTDITASIATRRRRRATAAWRSTRKREPDEVRTSLGWAPFDEEGRYHRSTLRQAQRGLACMCRRVPPAKIASASSSRSWIGSSRCSTSGLRAGRDYVVCGDWNIVRSRAGHQELDIESEEFGLPAGRARLAQ